jgi:hypothetical protein
MVVSAVVGAETLVRLTLWRDRISPTSASPTSGLQRQVDVRRVTRDRARSR